MTDVFVHIPRTAGQGLSQLVLQNYSRPYFSGDTEAEIRGLRASPPAANAVMGHLPVGVIRNARHITFLREPAARLLSEYTFHQVTPGAYHHDRIKAGLTVRDWMSDLKNNLLLDNMLCRFVSGAYVWEHPSRATMARAVEALCAMPAFGITERFDESVLLIARALHWQHPFAVPTNAKRRTVTLGAAPDSPLFRFDRPLYDLAADLFDDRVTRLGQVFAEALAAYREVMAATTEAHIAEETFGYEQPRDVLTRLRDIPIPPPIKAFLSAPL